VELDVVVDRPEPSNLKRRKRGCVHQVEEDVEAWDRGEIRGEAAADVIEGDQRVS
jgi:hypothetical protein